MNREVVITGLGAVSAIGQNLEEIGSSIEKAHSGIGAITGISKDENDRIKGAEIKGFNARKVIAPNRRKLLKVMSRDIQLSVVAADYAMNDAGLANNEYEPDRIGVSIGSSLINNDLDEIGAAFKNSNENGKINMDQAGANMTMALTPLWMLKYLPNMPACHISINYDLRGPSNSITTEGASTLQAIGEGFRIIQRNHADLMIVGGCDSKINGIALSKFDLLGLLPSKGQQADYPYHPFSKDTDYIIPGEASAIFVLEEKQRALKRKAKIYAEIKGFGTAPLTDYLFRESKDVFGRSLAMKRAINEAKISSDEIDMIVANGIGIKEADDCESESIKQILKGNNNVPVACVKPCTGYTGAANGSIETVAAIYAIKEKTAPHLSYAAEQNSDLNFLKEKAELRKSGPLNVLVNSFGMTGQAAALVLEGE